ncbi:MAG: gas vesicle protein K [candidate division NC10 bacterium]|nr:gas vesicle protein K [candidate division NC10 bacterium]
MHNALLESGRVTLLDLLDRLLETGVAVDGEIDLSVADVNLIHLGLKLVLASSTTLEQHNKGGATRLADPIDIPPDGSPGECPLGSALCPGPPILGEAEPQAAALVQPACNAEAVVASRSTPGQEQPGEWLHPGIGRFDGTQGWPARADEKALSRIDPARVPPVPRRVERSDFEPAKVERGLAKLVLTLVELIRRLMERQAIRKMEGGTLTEMQVERLGEAFRRLETRMGELKRVFGLQDEELNLDLGPLGALM